MTTATTESKTKTLDWAEVKKMVESLSGAGSHEELNLLEVKAKQELESVHRIMGIAGANASYVILSRSEFKRLEQREVQSDNGAAKIGAPRGRKTAKGNRTGERTQRGQGRGTIEATLKKLGGSGSTKDVKAAWDQIGSKTPLSVSMASGVKGGWLKRKGKGRQAIYSLV